MPPDTTGFEPSILVLLFVASLLASGCIQDKEAPDPTPAPDSVVTTDEGEKPTSRLTADDTVHAPTWEIGDWFGHHLYLQGSASEGRHYNTVVVDETPDGWLLAADDAQAAREEAAWDLPVVGLVGPALETTAFGAEWDLFRFPLEDGKTWADSVEVRDLDRYDLLLFDASFVVRFDPAIDVNGQPMPGFRIVGTTSDGETVVDASYIPAIRWYGHITVLDVRTQDPDDFFLRTTSMGHGTEWAGTYHVASGDLVIEHFGGFVAFQPTAIAPNAPETFTIPDDADFLFGQVFAYAWNGAAETVLVDPEGGVRETRAVHPPDGDLESEGEVDVRMVDEPALAGDWQVATGGGGPVWVAGASLFALTMEEEIL